MTEVVDKQQVLDKFRDDLKAAKATYDAAKELAKVGGPAKRKDREVAYAAMQGVIKEALKNAGDPYSVKQIAKEFQVDESTFYSTANELDEKEVSEPIMSEPIMDFNSRLQSLCDTHNADFNFKTDTDSLRSARDKIVRLLVEKLTELGEDPVAVETIKRSGARIMKEYFGHFLKAIEKAEEKITAAKASQAAIMKGVKTGAEDQMQG